MYVLIIIILLLKIEKMISKILNRVYVEDFLFTEEC